MKPRAPSLLPVGAAADDLRPRGALLPRAWRTLAEALGFHRRVTVAGVRYTERTFEPLRRAISRKGSGRKDFDAVFPDGTRLRIRATPWRIYADLSPPRLQALYEACAPCIRPGMRVLDLACSTGWSADWLSRQLGPSGAVVALDRDRESIAYAAARYRTGSIAFEHGFVEALAGEIDGSFSGALAIGALTKTDDTVKTLAEVWRTIEPGGFLVVAQPSRLLAGSSAPDHVTPAVLGDSTLCDVLDSVTGGPATPLSSPLPDYAAALARKAVQK